MAFAALAGLYGQDSMALLSSSSRIELLIAKAVVEKADQFRVKHADDFAEQLARAIT